MSPPKKVNVNPKEQTILREWRELVEEHYLDDIKHLKGHPDIVWGFEVSHAHIDEKETLRLEFHQSYTDAQIGNPNHARAIEAQGVQMRPVIESLNFPNIISDALTPCACETVTVWCPSMSKSPMSHRPTVG